MKIHIKRININNSNLNYYFNIIYKFRNNPEYLRLNNIKRVSKKDSKKWFLKNQDNRIFFLIKYENRNAGIFNFNKLNPTFSQVILKKFRNKKIGKISATLLLKKLKKLGYFRLITFASKNNIASYKIHKSISYNFKPHKNKNKFYKFYINTRNF